MADVLTSSFSITQYEIRAADIDFVGARVSITVDLLDSLGVVIRTRTFTRTFVELGITVVQANIIRDKIITRMKSEGIIN